MVLYLTHMVLVGAPGLGDLLPRYFLHSHAWCLHDHVSSNLLGPFHEIQASHNMVVSGSCAYTMDDFSNSQEAEAARQLGHYLEWQSIIFTECYWSKQPQDPPTPTQVGVGELEGYIFT